AGYVRVSCEVLRHLNALAEDRLGVPQHLKPTPGSTLQIHAKEAKADSRQTGAATPTLGPVLASSTRPTCAIRRTAEPRDFAPGSVCRRPIVEKVLDGVSRFPFALFSDQPSRVWVSGPIARGQSSEYRGELSALTTGHPAVRNKQHERLVCRA